MFRFGRQWLNSRTLSGSNIVPPVPSQKMIRSASGRMVLSDRISKRFIMAKTEIRSDEGAGRTPEVDDYIAGFPTDVQVILQRIREIAQAAAPDATEIISYRMPAFKGHGILIYFAAWQSHIGLYPPVAGDAAIEKAVAKYAGPKGNLQFPLDKPIPYQLIERIVKLRVKQDIEKAVAQRVRRKKT